MSPFSNFFGKKPVYQSIFPEKVRGLNDRQKGKFDYIATNYQRFSKNSKSYPTLLQAFFDRYDRAVRERVPVDVFFQAEEEALEIYKKKQREVKEKLDREVEEHQESIASVQKDTPNYRINQYRRIFIHQSADPILERLYGALVDYEKKYKNGLFQTTKVIAEAEYQQIVYNVVYGLEDFTQTKGKFLPFFFSQYSFALDKEDGSDGRVVKDIRTNVSIIFEKIKKVILWGARINSHTVSSSPFATFLVDKSTLDFREFFSILEAETDDIIKDFELKIDVYRV